VWDLLWDKVKDLAQEALNRGFKTFTSTLLYSKYQDFDGIIEIGESVGKSYGLDFYKRDFRIGWDEGRKISREMGFYRQKYCGCIYSEKERYLGSSKNSEVRNKETADTELHSYCDHC